MANKVIIVGLLCIVVAAVVQSAPQYAKNEEPTYDEDDSSEEAEKVPSTGAGNSNEDDYDIFIEGLKESFGTAADAGRRVGGAQRSDGPPAKPAQPESSSASDE